MPARVDAPAFHPYIARFLSYTENNLAIWGVAWASARADELGLLAKTENGRCYGDWSQTQWSASRGKEKGIEATNAKGRPAP